MGYDDGLPNWMMWSELCVLVRNGSVRGCLTSLIRARQRRSPEGIDLCTEQQYMEVFVALTNLFSPPVRLAAVDPADAPTIAVSILRRGVGCRARAT